MPSKDDPRSRFGANVRKRRQTLGISQEELAARADLDRTYISGIERGLRNVSLLNIVVIAKALGTKARELLSGVE